MDKTERDYWESNIALMLCIIFGPILLASGDYVGITLGVLTCITAGIIIVLIILCILIMKEREAIKKWNSTPACVFEFGNVKVINTYLLYEQEIQRRIKDGTMTFEDLKKQGIASLSKAQED